MARDSWVCFTSLDISGAVDITENVAKQQTVLQCRKCFSWFNQQTQRWSRYDLESAELLALCLRRIPQLKKELKLVDASWIWTEPHSKRLKIRVTVRKEVADTAKVVDESGPVFRPLGAAAGCVPTTVLRKD